MSEIHLNEIHSAGLTDCSGMPLWCKERTIAVLWAEIFDFARFIIVCVILDVSTRSVDIKDVLTYSILNVRFASIICEIVVIFVIFVIVHFYSF